MKQNVYRIEYKNGNAHESKAYSMELRDGKLYQCVKAPVGDQGVPSVIDGSKIERIMCVERNNSIEEETENAIWYAVQRDTEDDWGSGSYSLDEAMQMLRKLREDYPDALVAVIRQGGDPICIDEIREVE